MGVTALPETARRYVGIPFSDHGADWAGCSCWGLLCLWYREEYGVLLPSYDEEYATATDRHEIAALFAGGLAPDWITVPEPQVGDAVLFQIGGQPLHCGIWLTPEQFLHCERGTATCIGRFASAKWARRAVGVFRHVAMTARV